MHTVCARCQDFAIIAGQPTAALGLARGCWCRAEATFMPSQAAATLRPFAEPSDLHDLRALAARLDDAPGDDRDLDALIAMGGGFDATMAAPVLEPRTPASGSGRGRLFVLAGLGGPALLVAGLALWAGAGAGAGPDAPGVATARATLRAPAALEDVAGPGVCGAPAPSDDAATCSVSKGPPHEPGGPLILATAGLVPGEPPEAAEVAPPSLTTPRARPAERTAARSPAPLAPTVVAPEPEPEPVADPAPAPAVEAVDAGPDPEAGAGESSRQIEALLGLSGGAGAAATAETGVPQRPTKAQVAEAMRAVAPRVMNCGAVEAGAAGAVHVDATFAGATGQATNARVLGPLAGTAEAACIERAVRRARLPAFADPELRVSSYAFPLR